METLPAPEPERYGDHDAWYLAALEDGFFRRVFVVEYRAWRSRIRDLVRDQLSGLGLDSDLWRPAEEARDAAAFVFQVRLLLADELDCELAPEVWTTLQELAAVAEAISESSRAARLELAERYPDYFSDLDVLRRRRPDGPADPLPRPGFAGLRDRYRLLERLSLSNGIALGCQAMTLARSSRMCLTKSLLCRCSISVSNSLLCWRRRSDCVSVSEKQFAMEESLRMEVLCFISLSIE